MSCLQFFRKVKNGSVFGLLLLLAGKIQAQPTDLKIIKKEINYLSHVEFHGPGRLLIEQGDANELIMEAPEEVFNEIKLDADIGHLIIYRKKKLFKEHDERLTCRMVVKNLSRLVLSGGCVMEADLPNLQTLCLKMSDHSRGQMTINGMRFLAEVEDTAALEISGRVEQQDILIRDRGVFLGQNLKSLKCHLVVEGPGRAEVQASDVLSVSISGSGQVSYIGFPEKLLTRISRGGRLEQI